MNRSYEPDADRQLDDHPDRKSRADTLWADYLYANKEGYGDSWLLGHHRDELPPGLREAHDLARLRRIKVNVTVHDEVFDRR